MLSQIRRYGVVDERVLGAMAMVDRAGFVPEEYKHLAYEDRPLSIGQGQTISQPYTVARMIELLVEGTKVQRGKGTKVLEIGTGSGWETAILAKLFEKVYSVELIPELSRMERKNLDELQITNCQLLIGDGKKGWKKHAPYEAIIVAANADRVPQALIGQLKIGGRIVIPVRGEMMRGTKFPTGQVRWENFGQFSFVPLV